MKKNFRVIAVVSARGGSKGVPKKNIKNLNGKPLIFYTLKTLSRIKFVNKIVVSTDDKKISTIVKKNFPNIEIMMRPKNLATDRVPLTSVVKHVAIELEKKKQNFEFVLQIAPTCPFIKKETLKKIINILQSGKTNCVVTLKRIEHEHPYRAKKLDIKNGYFKSFITNKNVESFISRQDLPKLYCTSGAIYGRTLKLLKTFNEKNFCLGPNPIGVVVDEIEAINIDRPIDFKFAEFIVKNKL
jgi:CMP-N-acetylneuraminic acid synthetase